MEGKRWKGKEKEGNKKGNKQRRSKRLQQKPNGRLGQHSRQATIASQWMMHTIRPLSGTSSFVK